MSGRSGVVLRAAEPVHICNARPLPVYAGSRAAVHGRGAAR
jgi:hypothetical protein